MSLVQISGNTYPVREQIKALGGRWNAPDCCWEVDEAVADQCFALVVAAGPRPIHPLDRSPRRPPGIHPILEDARKLSRSGKLGRVEEYPPSTPSKERELEPAPSGMVRVTKDLLRAGKSARGGWSRKQLALLGVPYPLKHGWKNRMMGQLVSLQRANKFVELRNRHLDS